MQEEHLDRYAELIVRTGANVAPGQLVSVYAMITTAPLARAVAAAAYRAGARLVDIYYDDPYVDRTHVLFGPEESLSESPHWVLDIVETIERERGAFIQLKSPGLSDVMADLDQRRVGLVGAKQWRGAWGKAIDRRQINWTIASYPDERWARLVFGEPDVDRLWEAVAHAVRLDEPDPVTAWARHLERLGDTASWLNSLQLDSLHYRGPGTDLRVGLLPTSVFQGTRFTTAWGREHAPNLPTEEVFTSPDPMRAEGHISSTRPLALQGVTIVNDLRFELRDGRIASVTASTGLEAVEAQLAKDEGAARLGELALVDRASRVGQTGLTFGDTLFDENATSHIAYGHGFAFAVGGEGVANQSAVHTDFMVGGPEVEITGVTRDGREVAIIHQNSFALD